MITLNKDWFSSKPHGSWLIAKEDKRVTEFSGIMLTEQLTGAEKVGHSTSHIVRAGDKVNKTLGLPYDTDLTGKRIMHRDYLKDAWKLGPNEEDKDNLNYFIIKAEDIMAFVDDDVIVSSL